MQICLQCAIANLNFKCKIHIATCSFLYKPAGLQLDNGCMHTELVRARRTGTWQILESLAFLHALHKRQHALMKRLCDQIPRRTFPLHARGQALLVAAVLAAIALTLVHHTILVVTAGVGQVLSNSALEKALTPLTAVHPIVFALERKRE